MKHCICAARVVNGDVKGSSTSQLVRKLVQKPFIRDGVSSNLGWLISEYLELSRRFVEGEIC